MPNNAPPQISPTSPIGEIYRYRVVGPPGYSVTDLKTLEDWVLERRFKAVPGVIDVTGWGGKTKTYEITVDQRRLVQYGLSLSQVLQALNLQAYLENFAQGVLDLRDFVLYLSLIGISLFFAVRGLATSRAA